MCQTFARTRWAYSAIVAMFIAALLVNPALADRPSSQMASFYYPDGTQVTSANGEPDDAVLFRFSEYRRIGVELQFMTQHLTPGARYDIWLWGTNDGTDEFLVLASSARATVRGELNSFGFVSTDATFTNPNAPLYVVITDDSGDAVQTAYFPAP